MHTVVQWSLCNMSVNLYIRCTAKWPRNFQFRNSLAASRGPNLPGHFVRPRNLHTYEEDSKIVILQAHASLAREEQRCSAVSELQFANARWQNGRSESAARSPCERWLSVSRRTGERRTFWPCPKYCDSLTRALGVPGRPSRGDDGGVCGTRYIRAYRWTSLCLGPPSRFLSRSEM